jgi:hypothetical protein
MGLDTFASRSPDHIELTDEDIKSFEEAGIKLCGGIFSGNGNDGSFRGKIYVLLIQDITGESLFQNWISPETVREMHKALETCDPQQVLQENSWYRNSPADIFELRKFFRVCSKRGLGLINWG